MYEDVPGHLTHQLWTWTAGYINLSNDRGGQARAKVHAIANHMRYDFARAPQVATHSTAEQNMLAFIKRKCGDPEDQLRIIEFLLLSAHESSAMRLEEVLRLGNSAYAVSSDGKRLEMRATPEVKAQVEAVVASAAGSAGDHLANAWNEAYGRQPDPVKSYSESIKAVEAALAQRITPQNAKQTLGTMVADIRQAPQNFEFAMNDGPNSDGVETVVGMMRQLWEGQTSRHGGPNPTRPETVEEAKAAVHLGAALVQWGVSGAFGRR